MSTLATIIIAGLIALTPTASTTSLAEAGSSHSEAAPAVYNCALWKYTNPDLYRKYCI